eukprot:Opistho-2@61222
MSGEGQSETHVEDAIGPVDSPKDAVPTVASSQKRKPPRLRRPRPCPIHKLKGRGCEEDCTGRTFFKPSYKPTRREISLIHVSNGTQGAFDMIRLNPELFECGSRLPWTKPTSTIEDINLTSYEGPSDDLRTVAMHVVMLPDSDQFYALFDWVLADPNSMETIEVPLTPIQNGRIVSFHIDTDITSIHVTVTARVPVPNPATKLFETYTCSFSKMCVFPPVEKLPPAPTSQPHHQGDGHDVDDAVDAESPGPADN